MTPQTLAQFIHRLSPTDLARAAATVLQGRVLPEEETERRLFNDLVSYQAIQRRLDLIPVKEAEVTIRSTMLAGGYLTWQSVNGGLATNPHILQDIMERYFIGTVGKPDWRPIEAIGRGQFIIAFPEITISYLRNHAPRLPNLFTLERPSEKFMELVDEANSHLRGEWSRSALSGKKNEFLTEIGKLCRRIAPPISDQTQCAEQVFTVLSGEWLLERLAMRERRPFHPWENLDDRERCPRVLTHLLTAPEENSFARRLVHVARTLEAERWYAPDTIIHLAVLEELRECLDAVSGAGEHEFSESKIETVSDFAQFTGRLHNEFHSHLCNSGIIETAVSGSAVAAERLSRDGMAAISQRLDWRHWQKLRTDLDTSAETGTAIRPAEEITDDSPYMSAAPGQSWEERDRRFLDDIRLFILALSRFPVSPTRQGRPVRLQLRQLVTRLNWSEEYADFLFDFALHTGLLTIDGASNHYVPTGSVADFLEGALAGRARAVAAYFWQESFDEGPISEDHRELKHVFVQQFLAPAGGERFARLDAFWDWLAGTPRQESVARRWRRYVDDDDEVLLSIAISMARTMTWLGLAETSPNADQPELIRLSARGRPWLAEYRFDLPAGIKADNNAQLSLHGNEIHAGLDLPFASLQDLILFTEVESLGSPLKLRLDEDRLIESAGRGGDLGRLIKILKKHAQPAPDDSVLEPIRKIQKEFDQIHLRPSAGYIQLASVGLAREIAALPELKPLLETRSGKYLLLRPGANLHHIHQIFHRNGYLVREPEE